jgi:hypothetical protein
VVALGADTKVLRQLVVAVVRAALRAGVRVRLLVGCRLGKIAVLDRDVDALRHGASLVPLPVMPPEFWVASTKPEFALRRAKV